MQIYLHFYITGYIYIMIMWNWKLSMCWQSMTCISALVLVLSLWVVMVLICAIGRWLIRTNGMRESKKSMQLSCLDDGYPALITAYPTNNLFTNSPLLHSELSFTWTFLKMMSFASNYRKKESLRRKFPLYTFLFLHHHISLSICRQSSLR